MINENLPEKIIQKTNSETLSPLWIITELYYPENNQTGYYMTGIAEGLTSDFSVKVICGQPNYAARGTKAAKREVYKNVEIFRLWGTTLDKNVFIFRLINMMTLGFSMFLKILFKVRKNEELLVVSAPPSLPFIGAFAARIRQSPYTLIIQDKYPETMVAVGQSKPNSLTVKIWEKLNRHLYKNAKNIIVVGRDMQELVLNQLKPDKKSKKIPVEVIQNWASLEEIKPIPRLENCLLEELNLKDKFVFLYAGNMGHPQDIESIVECAARLKKDDRFHFLFIGSGVKRNWLEQTVKSNGLSNITILAPRPREEQNLFLNACDVGLVTLVKKMYGLAMPSRTYNFLAAGKPVLALTEKGSEVARVLEEDNVGWQVSPNSPDELLDKIYEIYSERDKIPQIQIKARKTALEKYSAGLAIEKYKKILNYASDNEKVVQT